MTLSNASPKGVGEVIVAHLQCGQAVARSQTGAAWRRVRRKLAWVPSGVMEDLHRFYRQSPVIPLERQKDLVALLMLFAHHAATAHAQRLMLEQDPQDRVVSKALAFLKDRFRKDIQLKQAGASSGASTRNLARLFRARTGASMIEHLHRLRIEHACEQLRQTHDKISKIGMECGFGSIQQFNRVFRNVMHNTPAAGEPRTGSRLMGI